MSASRLPQDQAGGMGGENGEGGSEEIRHLASLGFPEPAAAAALTITGGDMTAAVEWLLKNEPPSKTGVDTAAEAARAAWRVAEERRQRRKLEISYGSRTPVPEPLAPLYEVGGYLMDDDLAVREIQVINQWDEMFRPMIDAFKAPAAICGYTCLAICHVLASDARFAGKTHWRASEIEEMAALLSDPAVMLPATESVMNWVAEHRGAYIEAHSDDFASPSARDRYLRDWIANYEIGDWMRAHAPDLGSPVAFVRNIERDPHSCTHEELARLAEEEPFHDCRLFVQTHDGRSSYPGDTSDLVRPEAFAQDTDLEQRAAATYVADLLGHFVCYRLLMMEGGGLCLLVINTSTAPYLLNSNVAPGARLLALGQVPQLH